MQSMRSNSHGFTLIEVLVISPIIILIIGVFIGLIVSLTGETLSTRAHNTLIYNVQSALDTIEQDVTLSGAFLAQNNVALAAPHGADNATASFTNNGSGATDAKLILNALATTDSPLVGTRQLIPLPNLPNSCTSPQVGANQVMTYNIVYFVQGGTLWRRTIMPANYGTAGCGSLQPWQRSSCAPGQTASTCRAVDAQLATGVTSFAIEYRTAPQDVSPNTTAASTSANASDRQTALNTITTVKIKISATISVAGHDRTHTTERSAVRQGANITDATP